ncbi:MAG: metallopeptidase TldD-related protein [Acidimicrobiales bacterium]
MSRRFAPPSEVVEEALSLCRSSACAVIVEDGSEVDVRFACNTTTTNGWRHERRVAVVSMVETAAGTSVGVASGGGAMDLEELVRASEADAAGAPAAEDASPLVDTAASPPDADFDDPARPTDLSVLRHVLDPLAAHLDRARAEGYVLAGFATHRLDTLYLGTSAGVRRRHEQPTGSVELVARADDGARTAWVAAGSAWFDDVDMEDLHRRLEQRLAWGERRLELAPGRYETILPPDCTADLMATLSYSLSGRDALDGRSAFSAPGGRTRLGERLSSMAFELRSDPFERGVECTPFLATSTSGADVSVFDNGLPLGSTPWIDQGVLSRLEFHRAGARRAGTEVAPPIDNLVLELPGATAELEDLVARTQRGLLCTSFWYIREVDPVTLLQTGLTRDGVYLVEGGQVVGAVNNFRWNESPLGVLSRVIEAGATRRSFSREWNEYLNRTAMPALRVADFNMSTVSPAT